VTLRIREAVGEADLDESLAVYNEVWPMEAVTAEEAAAFYAATAAYVELLAEVDGSVAGSGLGAVLPSRRDVALALVTVRPDARRRGAGSALFAQIGRWAAARGADRLETRVAEDDGPSLSYALTRGFEIVSRESGLELELRDVVPASVAPPEGIEITPWDGGSELAAGMYEVAVEAFPDVPGEEDYAIGPPAEWIAFHLGGPVSPPEATFVALAEGAVVGYAKLRISPARPGTGTHGFTGVKRAWRSRGIAGALKRAQIAWAIEAGLERLETGNEVRNEPIRQLNERLGYRPVPGRILLRGPASAVI
jgi:GNAT superfamily N-acetyltransferase